MKTGICSNVTRTPKFRDAFYLTGKEERYGMQKRKTIILLALCVVVLMVLAVLLLYAPKTVGKGIRHDAITEFYYTEATSTNPPYYQRYHLYAAKEGYFLFHETREGNHWPLTEADRTRAGSIELTRPEWEGALALLEGGTVVKRQNETETGAMGPFLFLYWKGDMGKVQEFSFPDRGAEDRFLQWCLETIQGGV